MPPRRRKRGEPEPCDDAEPKLEESPTKPEAKSKGRVSKRKKQDVSPAPEKESPVKKVTLF